MSESQYPAMVPFTLLMTEPELAAFAKEQWGGLPGPYPDFDARFLALMAMCCAVLPDGAVGSGCATLGGAIFYAPATAPRGVSPAVQELWTCGMGLGASAHFSFEKHGTGVCVLNESDTEPFQLRTMRMLEHSTWLVLRSPAQALAMMG